MTPENFIYWLQGYAEICGETPTQNQWDIIKDHISHVLKKETPVRINPNIFQDKQIPQVQPNWGPLQQPFLNTTITC